MGNMIRCRSDMFDKGSGFALSLINDDVARKENLLYRASAYVPNADFTLNDAEIDLYGEIVKLFKNGDIDAASILAGMCNSQGEDAVKDEVNNAIFIKIENV